MKGPKDPVKNPRINESAYNMVRNVLMIPMTSGLPEKVKGLLRIMHQFPQFEEDFPDLYFSKEKVIEKTNVKISRDVEHWELTCSWECDLVWKYSNTSLAEYFHNLKKNEADGDFFWGEIENVFSIKRGTLRHLIDNNVGKLSKDYEKIKNILGRELKADIDKLLSIENLISEFHNWFEEPAGEGTDNDTKNKLSKLFSNINNVISGKAPLQEQMQ